MKRLFRLLLSRVGLVSMGILLQLLVLTASLVWFRELGKTITTVCAVASWILVLVIVAGPSNPAYKMAWLIPILGFPVLGLFLYLFFGGNRLSRRLKRRMAIIDETLEKNLTQDPAVLSDLAAADPAAAAQARYLSEAVHCPVWANTETEFLPSGEATFVRMREELERAEKTIYLEYFIVEAGKVWDGILEILKEKAAAGVDVRLIYDDFGCIRRLPTHYDRELAQYGIRARAFNRFVPLLDSRLNNRDHRKFLLIDGKVGFTGGVNLADEYANLGEPRFGHWKDCSILLRGDAVWSMTVMFLSMWNHVTGAREMDAPPPPAALPAAGWVQPYLDSPLDNEAVGRTVFANMISRAERRVWIMTPYLIIDDGMAETLTCAAKSGVDVRIITPGVPDKPTVYEMTRANYAALLEGRVRIFEYTPGFVHSKLFLADDRVAAVGTVNLDFRSLYLHFEDGVWLCRTPCLTAIEREFSETFPQCREVTRADTQKIRLPRRLFRAILRLLSPLM